MIIDAQRLFEMIEDRRKELGLSQAEVSMRAFNRNDTSAIQNIKRGSVPSVEKVAALCDVLGLEFYVGPDRRSSKPETTHPFPGDVKIEGEEFTLIDRFDVNVSAGPGLVPIGEAASGQLAFTRKWLLREGINARLSGLVRVRGDSMAPTIPDGAMVLVHMPENEVKRQGIYAFSYDGEAMIKRLVPTDHDHRGKLRAIVMVSDNPVFEPRILTGIDLRPLRIVGRVRLVLHTV